MYNNCFIPPRIEFVKIYHYTLCLHKGWGMKSLEIELSLSRYYALWKAFRRSVTLMLSRRLFKTSTSMLFEKVCIQVWRSVLLFLTYNSIPLMTGMKPVTKVARVSWSSKSPRSPIMWSGSVAEMQLMSYSVRRTSINGNSVLFQWRQRIFPSLRVASQNHDPWYTHNG
jgi:hypothetical protein